MSGQYYNTEHPWLDFQDGIFQGIDDRKRKLARKKLRKLLCFPVFAHPVVDWGFLYRLRPMDELYPTGADELEGMMDIDCGDYKCKAWSNLFKIHEEIYIEPTYQFYSSFEFNENELDWGQASISFVLGGQMQRMSLIRFGVALGLYDEDDLATDGFLNHLDLGQRKPDLSQNVEFWNRISSVYWPGHGRAPLYSTITDPRHRAIFVMIDYAITNRKSGVDRVHPKDMCWFRCVVDKVLCNVAYIVASWMNKMAKGAKQGSVICGGQYVTRIGNHLGFLGPGFDRCTQLMPGMRLLDLTWFKSSNMVESLMFPYNEVVIKWKPPKNVASGSSSQHQEEEGGQQQEEPHVHENVPHFSPPPHVSPPRGDHPTYVDDIISRLDNMNTNFSYMGNQLGEWRDEYRDGYNELSSRIANVQEDMGRLHTRFDYHDYLMDSQFQHHQISYTDFHGAYHPYGDPPGFSRMDVDTSEPPNLPQWQENPWDPEERHNEEYNVQVDENTPSGSWDWFFGRG